MNNNEMYSWVLLSLLLLEFNVFWVTSVTIAVSNQSTANHIPTTQPHSEPDALNSTTVSAALNSTTFSAALNSTQVSSALNSTTVSVALNSTTVSHALNSTTVSPAKQHSDEPATLKSSTMVSKVILGLIVGCSLAAVILLVLVGIAVALCVKRKRSKKHKLGSDSLIEPESVQCDNNDNPYCTTGFYGYSNVRKSSFLDTNIYGGVNPTYAEISADAGSVKSWSGMIGNSREKISVSHSSLPPSQPDNDDIYSKIGQSDQPPALPGGHPTMLNSGKEKSNLDIDPYAVFHEPGSDIAKDITHDPEESTQAETNEKILTDNTLVDVSPIYSKPLKRASTAKESVPVSTEESANVQQEETLKQSVDVSELYAKPNKLRPSSHPVDISELYAKPHKLRPSSHPVGEVDQTPPPVPPKDDSLMD